MFPFHLFSYRPNERTCIYALFERSECVYVRVMDYAHHTFIDNPSSLSAARSIARLTERISNGQRPIANFRTLSSLSEAMPCFRSDLTPPLVHETHIMYIPSTVSWFGLLAMLFQAFYAHQPAYSPAGRLHKTLSRCDAKTRGVEFLIRISYATFNRIDTVLPRAERNQTLKELIK